MTCEKKSGLCPACGKPDPDHARLEKYTARIMRLFDEHATEITARAPSPVLVFLAGCAAGAAWTLFIMQVLTK